MSDSPRFLAAGGASHTVAREMKSVFHLSLWQADLVAFTDFVSPSRPAEVVRSPRESEALGMNVYRLTLPRDSRPELGALLSGITSAQADLVIVRYPAEWVELAGEIAAALPDRMVLNTDTLVYFVSSLDSPPPKRITATTVIRRMPAQANQITGCIRESFSGYLNHYAANPCTPAIDVAGAYADWAAQPHERRYALAAFDGEGHAIACAVLEDLGPVHEVLLAGVVPRARQRGVYGALMQHVDEETRRHAVPWVISTQAWNIAPQRTWIRLGLQPAFAVTTLHVLERSHG